MADEHGTVWAVGERECSIQRRHQKIIEEAPSPLVERTPGMRDKLFDAARLAATAIGYTGAGTVEFMASTTDGGLLLPRDEHPAAGRAPGHRSHHRSRPRRAATARRRRRPSRRRTAALAGLRRSRPGCTPRTRPRTGSRRPARCTTSTCPNATTQFGLLDRARCPPRHRHRRRLGGVGVLRPDAREGHLLRADAAAGRSPARRRAGPHPDSRRPHQPRPARQRVAPPGLPRRRHRHGVLRHPRPGGAGRTASAGSRGTALSAIAAALADAAHNRSTATVLGAAPSGWRNLASGLSDQAVRRRRRSRPTTSGTASRAPACDIADHD